MMKSTEEVLKALYESICKLYRDGEMSVKELFTMSMYAHDLSSTNIEDNVDDETDLNGKELYTVIQDFLCKYLDDFKQTIIDNDDEEDILTFVATKWKLYKKATKVLNCACLYLNSNWITRKRTFGEQNMPVYKIYQLGYVLWKNNILEHFVIPAVNGALKLIERDRKRLPIDSSLVSNLIDCMVSVGLKYDESEDLTFYKEKFEVLFLKETERFYNEEGTSYLQNNSVTKYMVKIEQRFDEENKRIEENLVHKSTTKNLTKICERSLIQRHLDAIYKEFEQLLELDKNEDLERTYLLVKRNEEDLRELSSRFGNHILTQGLIALEKNCKPDPSDIKIYATTIFAVFKKYDTLLSTSFKGHDKFTYALNYACSLFLNRNEIVSSAKSSEFLAQYCDVLLQKSNNNMDTADLHNNFKDVISLYKYLENRNLFESHYLKLFFDRLMYNTSVGLYAENLMITEMMESNNFVPNYTKELKIMLDEIDKSINLSQNFQSYLIDSNEFLETEKTFKLNFKVLSQFVWKISDSLIIRYPDPIEKYVMKFKAFHSELYPKKKLTICHKLCNGTVVTNHFQNKYTIRVNSIQMSVLLQYNMSCSWTLSELVNQTKIEMKYLLPSLQVLIKSKLLKCRDSQTNLKSNSVISLNQAYKKKNPYIDLNVPIIIKQNIQQHEEIDKWEECRKEFFIQYYIVSVLKNHKVMKDQKLFEDVSNRITQFPLNDENFKKNVKKLVEKGYLEYCSEDNTYYKYLP